MIRLRKELIQTRSKVTDLQDELEEKTSLYLNAIKVSFESRFRLRALFIKVCAIITGRADFLN